MAVHGPYHAHLHMVDTRTAVSAAVCAGAEYREFPRSLFAWYSWHTAHARCSLVTISDAIHCAHLGYSKLYSVDELRSAKDKMRGAP